MTNPPDIPAQEIDPGTYARAILNILEDSSEERSRLRDTQKAVLNILDDFYSDRTQLHESQRALINILEDVDSESKERKQAEDTVRRLNEELEQRVAQRTAQLEAANRELEEFSYSMSHDMYIPLRAIDGFSQLLLDGYGEKLDDDGRRMLQVVRTNVQRMGQLMDDIVHFIRMDKVAMTWGDLDVAALARDAFTRLQSDQPARRLRLDLPPLPPAWGDRDMIYQVLLNLLSNAIKFSPAEGEAVIEVGGTAEGTEHVYYVKDHGVGFDMQYAAKLFKVFERVHPTGQYQGTGIGLAIVKRIITRHGGRVWAEGQVGQGATFYFALPLAAQRE